MLGKLSIRNAKRQAKDYIIYFITVIISVALMFSFNSLAVSKDISELSSSMKAFSKSILGIRKKINRTRIIFMQGTLH